jgi:hypothetical protein
VTDVLYLLVTLASFVLLALLVGLLGRRLDDPQPGGDR